MVRTLFNFRIDPELLARLRNHSEKASVSVSQIIREGIEEQLRTRERMLEKEAKKRARR
jgi:predicted DNA-binding protein